MLVLSSIGFINGNWDLATIKDIPLQTVIENYEDFRIVVSDTEGSDKKEYRWADLKAVAVLDNDKTVAENIEANEDLLTVFSITKLSEINRVISKDLWEYKVDLVLGNHSYSGGQVVPFTLRTDIVISSAVEGLTADLETDCLLSVNGTIYPTIHIDDKLYIMGAAWELANNRSCTIHVLDFSQVGGIEKIKIDKYNLSSQRTLGADQLYLSMCIIELPTSVVDKKTFLVEAGRLQLNPGYIERFGPTTIKLNIHTKPAIKNVLQRPLGHRRAYFGELEMSNALAEVNFRPGPYLTQGDSMVCIFKNSNVYEHIEHLNNNGIENEFTTYRNIEGIVVTDHQEVVNYNCMITDAGGYLLRGQDLKDSFFLYSENEDGDSIVVQTTDSKRKKDTITAEVHDFYTLKD